MNYNGDVEALPQDTSFRRAYANWIRKGEKTGWGYGVFVFGGLPGESRKRINMNKA